MNTCPDCKCQFVQPFKCITCGAEHLYDATVRSLEARVKALETALRKYGKHLHGECHGIACICGLTALETEGKLNGG